jgi:RNase H-fold protein (predicted Holliday junction resolvase)
MSKDILSLDPGRDKVGTAVLSRDGEEKEKTIIKKEDLVKHLTEVFNKYDINIIVLGNGTGAEELIEEIKGNIEIEGKELKLIDEQYTTEEAQARYLAEKPMSRYEKLLRKFINWKVNKPLDDYAALIIAEKYLKKLDKKAKEH